MVNDINILASTFFDTGTILRKQKVVNEETGVTENKEVVIAKDFKCALSKNNRNEMMNIDGVGKIVESYSYFTMPSIDLRTGDKLIVKSLSGEDTFIVSSKPFVYFSHLEVSLSYKDRV